MQPNSARTTSGSGWKLVPFLKIPFSEKNYLKTEVAFAFHSADYQFSSGVNGIASQKYINLNFKWLLKNRVNNNGNVELSLGPGVYTF